MPKPLDPPCEKCGGAGTLVKAKGPKLTAAPCPKCKGTGTVRMPHPTKSTIRKAGAFKFGRKR
jgi:DnaJ-class molecular chaperone